MGSKETKFLLGLFILSMVSSFIQKNGVLESKQSIIEFVLRMSIVEMKKLIIIVSLKRLCNLNT